jgi:hypothetical protein
MSGERAIPNGEEATPAKRPVQSDMSPGMSANKNMPHGQEKTQTVSPRKETMLTLLTEMREGVREKGLQY